MPRPRPPYLHKTTSRHGKTVWYVRKSKVHPRIRIHGEFGSPAFMAAYQEAVQGKPMTTAPRGPADSFASVLHRYRASTEWAALSAATRKQRETVLRPILEKVGQEPIRYFDKPNIQRGLDRRRDTPAQARHFFDALAGVLRWAVAADILPADPTAGIKRPRPAKTAGFPTWTEEEVARYEAKWPIGTRQRVALDVLLYTGLRRGDAARLGEQHIVNGGIVIETEKTAVVVAIPMLDALRTSIEAAPKGKRTFISRADGEPYTKESFGNRFRDWCNEAGVPDKSAHGLRKAGATRAAENGATEAELDAIFGWTGGRMAAVYTRAANRKKLAKGGIKHLVQGPTFEGGSV